MQTPENAIAYGPIDAGHDLPVPNSSSKQKMLWWVVGSVAALGVTYGGVYFFQLARENKKKRTNTENVSTADKGTP